MAASFQPQVLTSASTIQNGTSTNEVLVLADEKSRQLKVFCPLCNNVYRVPHIASCGHTFCQECVSEEGNIMCPLDGLQISLLVKNLAVAEEVGELKVHCRYGCKLKEGSHVEYEADPNSCPVVTKLSERSQHENECGFAPVSCPNSSLCQKMLRKDLSEHLRVCKNTKCPHSKYNCPFQGTSEEISEHLKHCKFEGVKGVLSQMESRLSAITEELGKKDALIEQLTTSVTELTSEVQKVENTSNATSRRIDTIEDQQTDMRKAIVEANNNVALVLSELNHVQQQIHIGASGNLSTAVGIEVQHLFKCQGTFVGHKGPIWSLCKSRDLLFSASSDNTIKVWNLSHTYTGPRTLTGHDGIVLALSTKGEYLFSGSSDKTIKVWKIKSLELHSTIPASHNDPVCVLACSDSQLFSGSLRSIKVWDISGRNLVKELPSQNHWVRALVVHGKYLYSGSYQAVKIWSLETLDVVHVLKCTGGSVYSLAVTSHHIACGTYENLIHVWDVQTLKELRTLSGHVGSIYSLAVLKVPGKTLLFSASYDKTIRVWNLDLMTCAQILARHEGSVSCLVASGGRIISGAVDSTLKVWQ